MKHLAHLNKYFLKFKWYLILGTIFTIISNLFGVIPAQVVRHSLDLVKETIDIYFLYDGTKLQTSMYEIFAFSIALFGGLILVMALLVAWLIRLLLIHLTIIIL